MPAARDAAALPDLPSLYQPLPLREGADALARAVALAPSRGAGLLCWTRSLARLEAAVVLEPDRPLRAARPAILAAASALAESLAAFAPPEIPVAVRWPASVAVNLAEAATLRLAAPEGVGEREVPGWLAVGVEVRLAFPPGRDPGLVPHLTSLEEEGFGTLAADDLLAAWARHLMGALYDWTADGMPALAERYLHRLEGERAPDTGAALAGRRLDAVTGDLLWPDGRRDSLRDALAAGAGTTAAPAAAAAVAAAAP